MLKRAWVIGLVCLSLAVHSQENSCSFTVFGRVISEEDQQPLSKALVSLGDQTTVTDSLGKYSFKNLCSGNYLLTCQHIGCQPIQKQLIVNSNLALDLLHHPHVEGLDAFEIIASESENSLGLSGNRLNIEDQSFSSATHLAGVSENINGVRTFSSGSTIGKPVINGLHSNRVLILRNGVRQEGQQWGREHAPEIDPFSLYQLQLLRGAEAVASSFDAVGGALLLKSEQIEPNQKFEGKVRLQGVSNGRQGLVNVNLKGSLGFIEGLGWQVQGSLKKAGNRFAPNYYLDNSGNEEANFSYGLAYHKKRITTRIRYAQYNTTIGILSASHIGNLSDLEQAFQADSPFIQRGFSYDIQRPRQTINHETVEAQSNILFNKNNSLELTYSRQYNKRAEYDSDTRFQRDEDAAQLWLELTTHQYNAQWNHYFSSKWKSKFGFQYLAQGNTFEGRFFIPNYKKYVAGSFASVQYRHKKWSWNTTVRTDWLNQEIFVREEETITSEQTSFSGISYASDLSFRSSNSTKHAIILENNWRAPHINELYSNGLHHGAASIEIGDEYLTQENAIGTQYLVEITKKNFSVENELFLKSISGFINLIPSGEMELTIRGAFPTFRYEQHDALLYGMNTSVSYFVRRLTVFGSASMLRARNTDASNWISQMPSDQLRWGVRYANQDFWIFRKQEMSISGLYEFEQTRFSGTDFVPPPSAFTLWNLEYQTSLVKEESLTFGVQISNLLNVSYRQYLNRFRYYVDEMGRTISFFITIPIKTKTTTYE